MSLRAALLFAIVAGCSSPIDLRIELPEKSATLVLSRGLQNRLYAAASADELGNLDLGEPPLVLTVFDHPHTLDETQLAPGWVDTPRPDELSRPLPEYVSVRVAKIDEGGTANLNGVEPDEVASEVAALRIPALDVLACVSSPSGRQDTGCVALGGERCLHPCPDPPIVAEPTEPAPPEPPQLTPCLPGFAEAVEDGIAFCRRRIPSGAGCSDGERLNANGMCVRVGSACDRTWPDVSDDALFVASTAPPGGDGTRAHPFQSIDDALTQIGSAVALARGEYEATKIPPNDVSIVGACAAETRLSWSRELTIPEGHKIALEDLTLFETPFLVLGELSWKSILSSERLSLLGGARAVLTEVGISNTSTTAIRVLEGAELIATELSLTELRGEGVEAAGMSSTAQIRGLSIRHTADEQATLIRSVRAWGGASVQIDDGSLDGAMGEAIILHAATATLSNVSIARVRASDFSYAVTALAGARLFVHGLDLSENDAGGIQVDGDATILSGTDIHIDAATTTVGAGLRVLGGTARLSRVSLLQAPRRAILLDGDASAHLEDVVIVRVRGTRVDEEWVAEGIQLRNEATLSLHRALLFNVPGHGLRISNGTVEAADLTFEYSGHDPAAAPEAAAILMLVGTKLTVDRALIRDTRGSAIIAQAPDLVVLRDIDIEGTRQLTERIWKGSGLVFRSVQPTLMERIRARDLDGTAIEISSDQGDTSPSFEVRDLIIDDVRGGAIECPSREALFDRVRITKARPVAVLARARARLSMENTSIEDSPRGVLVEDDSRVQLSTFAISRTDDAAVEFHGAATLFQPEPGIDLRHGKVAQCAVGARIESETPYATTRLFQEVVFDDNELLLELK